jgi:glycosyltransferase involved in cell wall biosynthesis
MKNSRNIKPKIFYAIGARAGGQGLSLVAQKAGEILSKKDMLDIFVCYGYDKKYKIKKMIANLKQVYFQPFKFFSFLPSRYYYTMKRNWIDKVSSRLLIKSKAQIFHGWTHSSLNAIRIAKEKKMITILERGNSHPLHTKNILKKEYGLYKTQDYHDIKNDYSFLKKYNLWRYEFNEAIIELNEADYIFVSSQFCAETYIEYGINKEKLIVIPRGFDSKKYLPRSKQQKNDKFILLFVGNLQARKGIKYILEAWVKVNLKNSELWFVGEVGNEVSHVINLFKHRCPNIKFFGKIKDPSKIYQEASAFVFPSLDEGSAKVTYEAMASALPCIFTKNSGAMANDESAIFVPPRSTKALASSIKLLYDNIKLRNSMGKRARSYIKKYTWEFYQANLIKAYKKIYVADR